MIVKYNNKPHKLIFNTGTVWRAPPIGVITEIHEGIEYDLTNYIEDEGWLIEDENGLQHLIYKSECEFIK